MKKLLIIALSLIVIIMILLVINVLFFTEDKQLTTSSINSTSSQPILMCYQYSKQTQRGYTDRALLKLSILGDKVTGEYKNLPAEKDSKVGTFIGSVGVMDPKISGRIADVWWNSTAEGINVTEQLKIIFGEGSAVALFGEMVDRGDGVYIYKDISKLTSGFQMTQTYSDCSFSDIVGVVNSVIDKNTKTISGGNTGSITEVNNGGNNVKNTKTYCTQDAKICKNGIAVGRTGPNCEFAPCPEDVLISGVAGIVTIGPTCPVVRQGDISCADKPYSTTIQVIEVGSPKNSPFTTTESAQDGKYKINLPPGEYSIQPVGGSVMPRCEWKNITIKPSTMLNVNLFCDSGIR